MVFWNHTPGKQRHVRGRERAWRVLGSLSARLPPWPVRCVAPRHFLSSVSLAGCSHSQLTPRYAHPHWGHPKPLLPCRTLCVFGCARVCANACPAPAPPGARHTSSYGEARHDQSLGVSLGTNEAIPEDRVTNRNCSASSVK